MYYSLVRSNVCLCMLFFLPGLLCYPFFKDGYARYFTYDGSPYFLFFVGGIIYFISIFISAYFFSGCQSNRVVFFKAKFIIFLMLVIGLLYFLLSFYFFMNFNASFRHKSRLAEAGILVSILFFLKPLIYTLVAIVLAHVINGGTLSWKTKVFLWLSLWGGCLSINASLQVIFPIIVLLIIYFPLAYRIDLLRLLFTFKGVICLLLMPFILALVVLVGIAGKIGYGFVFSAEGLEYLREFGDILFPRISTSLFSFVTVINGCFFNGDCSGSVLGSFSSTFFNRASILIGGGYDAQLIDTVNRFNYLYVFENHAERAGASPGPLASMFYFPFYPLGFLVIPLLYCFLFSCIYRHLKAPNRMTVVSILVFIYLLLPFFEAPVNILYVIDPMFFSFVFFVVLTRSVRNFYFLGD